MTSAMTKATISSLPTELRCQIWETIARASDVSNLLQVDRRTRAEVLSQIPGGKLPWGEDYAQLILQTYRIDLDKLVIVVDSDLSSSYFLRFEATTSGALEPMVWSVSDLDSPLARCLQHLRPRHTVVEFLAPRGGYHLAAILIMRAKLFDVMSILTRLKRPGEFPEPPSYKIRFREHEEARHRAKRFWVNRVAPDIVRARHPERLRNRKKREAILADSDSSWRRNNPPVLALPRFYECLLLPLVYHPLWRSAHVVFDRPPTVRESSFLSRTLARRENAAGEVHWQKHETFHGVEELLLHNWRVCGRLPTTWAIAANGMARRRELESEVARYQHKYRLWGLTRVYNNLSILAAYFRDLLAQMHGEEADRLKAHILRTWFLSRNNTFSAKHKPDKAGLGDWKSAFPEWESRFSRRQKEVAGLRATYLSWANYQKYMRVFGMEEKKIEHWDFDWLKNLVDLSEKQDIDVMLERLDGI